MMKWLMGLALLGIGVALAFAGGRMVYRSKASKDWPTAQGTVLTSRVETLRSKRAVSFRPEVSYRYEVNGVPYTSDTVAFDGHGAGGLADAQAVSRHYAAGSPVTLHYEPEDPSVACLQCGDTGVVNYLVTLGGAVFALVAAWGLVELARSSLRDGKRAAPPMRAKAR
ncbi:MULTISPECIES: DUF3592 domain-containing protein [Corallococcus]|uniref:DUF3592 domain-containing protein n=2 Tax=Corallococcus TaxID=83461 RepID=A0A7Y4NBW3_9BACT|nr:DUF3592 domain-containing protein [Corallococcus exercitus]NOK08229.1 DUF3592 domain-containing protein [Corallococcus exercitus]GMU08414.1 hypothetical protein ASNO1_46670 [Corallococcus sp. NO1]